MNIEKLARDAHLDVYGMGHDRHTFKWVIEQFADLILEEAAKVCDGLQEVPATEARHCAQDIRALKT